MNQGSFKKEENQITTYFCSKCLSSKCSTNNQNLTEILEKEIELKEVKIEKAENIEEVCECLVEIENSDREIRVNDQKKSPENIEEEFEEKEKVNTENFQSLISGLLFFLLFDDKSDRLTIERIQAMVEIENSMTKFLEVVEEIKTKTLNKINQLQKLEKELRETKELWRKVEQSLEERVWGEKEFVRKVESQLKKVQEKWERREKEERKNSKGQVESMKEIIEKIRVELMCKEERIWVDCSIPLKTEDFEFLSKCLVESRCLNLYGPDNNKPKKLFQGTRDGFTSESFHDKCDHQGKTVVLIRTTTGKTFGGFANVEWDSTSSGWRSDPEGKSFLFSLDDREKYPLMNNHQNEIFCHRYWGPSFGNSCLNISNDCNSKNSSSWTSSHPTRRCYVIPTDSTMLVEGKTDGSYNYFQVSEYEVWSIQ